MSAEPKPKSSSAARMRKHRARMRARGLKPVTIWTFDTDDPAFKRRIEEDIRRLKNSPQEREELAAIEGVFLDYMIELDEEERGSKAG